MENLEAHEAFLRAIFDVPHDDTPRLVYADFLEENGEPDRAEFIRVACEHARLLIALDPGQEALAELPKLVARRVELQKQLARKNPALFSEFRFYERGFGGNIRDKLFINVDELIGPDEIRRRAVLEHPDWFAATGLRFGGGPIETSRPFEWLFASTVFSRVTGFELRGREPDRPVITGEGVKALATWRGAERLMWLYLWNSKLGDDAVSALIDSPYLGQLRRLQIIHGNTVSDDMQRRLLERFGPDVVR